jgi:hypothetical protein
LSKTYLAVLALVAVAAAAWWRGYVQPTNPDFLLSPLSRGTQPLVLAKSAPGWLTTSPKKRADGLPTAVSTALSCSSASPLVRTPND